MSRRFDTRVFALLLLTACTASADRAKGLAEGNALHSAVHVGEARARVDALARSAGIFPNSMLRGAHGPGEIWYETSGWNHHLVCGRQVRVIVMYDGNDRVTKIADPVEVDTGCM